MADVKVDDIVRIKDRADWVGQYKLAGSEGKVIDVREATGFVVVHLTKTDTDIDLDTSLTFRLDAVEPA